MDNFVVDLSFSSYLVFKAVAAGFFVLDALSFLPFFQRDFGTAYQPNSPIKNRRQSTLVATLWLVAAFALILPQINVIAALSLAVIFRYYYVHARPTNLFRGGGAVGMFPNFIATTITLVELLRLIGVSWSTIELVLNMMLFHVGVITLCAGIYKCVSGYFKNEGFEYAIANPLWSYWARFVENRRFPSKLLHPTNIVIASHQTLIGILMINPETRIIGTLLLAHGFFTLGFILKLGTLPFLVITYALLVTDFDFATYTPTVLMKSQYVANIETIVTILVFTVAASYLFIKACQYYNYYFNGSFPTWWQKVQDKISFYAPILIWRVFSADIINFHVRLYEQDPRGNRRLINDTNFKNAKASGLFARYRFFHVAESCVFSSMFVSLRYDKNNEKEVEEKLLRYSKTLVDQMEDPNNELVFTYVYLEKQMPYIKHIELQDWVVKDEHVVVIPKADTTPIYSAVSGFVRPLGGFGKYTDKSLTSESK